MTETMTLRDHDEPCIHGMKMAHLAPICPGGKEITLRRPKVGEPGWADDTVWMVEADDA